MVNRLASLRSGEGPDGRWLVHAVMCRRTVQANSKTAVNEELCEREPSGDGADLRPGAHSASARSGAPVGVLGCVCCVAKAAKAWSVW